MDDISSQVPLPLFVIYFSPFAPWCDCVIVDDGYLSTVANDGYECCVGENTILSETGDVSVTESSNFSTLEYGPSSDKSLTCSDLVVSVDNDGSIEYARISSKAGTFEGSVDVSESKITVELENGKA